MYFCVADVVLSRGKKGACLIRPPVRAYVLNHSIFRFRFGFTFLRDGMVLEFFGSAYGNAGRRHFNVVKIIDFFHS